MREIKHHDLEFYKSGVIFREWRWRVRAKNGKIIGASSEGYKNRKDCVYNAQSLGLSLLEHDYE